MVANFPDSRTPFRIHLFTPEARLENESSILTSLLAAGLDMLHIRKPSLDAAMIKSLIEEIPERFRKRIVIHSHPDLASELGTGVQINSRCSLPAQPLHTISKSCHSIEEVEMAQNLSFVTLSPVFDSISKTGYKSRFTRESLSKASLGKAVALGGITLENLTEVEKLGFGGAALLGDIWNRQNGVYSLLKYLRMRNFPLQFITDAPDVSSTTAQAARALQGGCRWIQVRMKNAPAEDVADALRHILPLCEEKGATLIVDDYVELAGLCHGVHLGQNDTSVAEARRAFSPDKIIGLTVNNERHIRESRSSLPDYYGVGPLRFTSTKKNLSPVLGMEGYRRLAPGIRRPFVAIGGVISSDIPDLVDAGASGIAVSSVINRSPSPETATKELMNILSHTLNNI